MSEYQYYEFSAIDRPLSAAEMAQLRKLSSRGQISASSFINHYEWGDLKADPSDWMRRYFDAFVYTANWCSCRLALRVPLATFRKAELNPFVVRHALAVTATDKHWIIDWFLDESENYDRFAAEDGRGWMTRLAPLRDELLRGDLRPLYLGWLAAAGTLDDDALEPEVPPGLSALSPPQQALVEFIEVDPDLLAAAASGSERIADGDPSHAADIDAWLAEWSPDDMADVLKRIALGRGHESERRVRAHYAAWAKARHPKRTPAQTRRTVGRLRKLAQSSSGKRRARESEARAAAETERRRQRESDLRRLMADAAKHWAAIDVLAARGSASGYEQAVRALTDLAEGYGLTSTRKEFDRALRRWLVRHAARAALLRRLTEAGLWSG
jgi:hypothetical protein